MEKLAILELNESMLRVSIYKVSNGRFQMILDKNQPFNLGKEISAEELIRTKTRTEPLNVIKIYRKLIESYKATKIVAVASKILLQARNYRGFVDEVYNNTAMTIQILSDEEFLKILYNSVINSIDNSKGFFFYVGSDFTGIVKYNRRTMLASQILPFGIDNVGRDEQGNERSALQIEEYVGKQLSNVDILKEIDSESNIVGCGNAFLAFGKIAKKIARYPLDIDNNFEVSKDVMEKTYQFVSTIELEKIGKIKGINFIGADKVITAVAFVKALYLASEAESIAVSSASLRHGLVIQNTTVPAQAQFSDLLSNSLDNFYEFSKSENSINEYVYQMAMILFKQLKVMHKLPRFYVKPLRIASFLYDCGAMINYDNLERNGFDVILNAGICGASHKELLIASFICLCQDLDNLSLSEWLKYKDILNDEDLDAVRKLGVILSLARALNASRKPLITDIVCDILGDSIIVKTITEGNAEFEIMEGMKIASTYKKVFKKSLQII